MAVLLLPPTSVVNAPLPKATFLMPTVRASPAEAPTIVF